MMAVLIEAISVVILAEAIVEKFPGGLDAFEQIVPNQTLCADGEIARVGFMTPQDVEAFVKELQCGGLEFLRDGESVDIAVVDQLRGPISRCSWLEFGHANLGDEGPLVAACRRTGSQIMEISYPLGWNFDTSLSANSGFIPTEDIQDDLVYLRHENGLDVYYNMKTGKEVYIGRTHK